MPPKTQGLQVLLIVFVMLTVVLGVTTYLYNKRADEATKAALAAAASERQAKDATAEKQKECDLLKKLVGYPERTTEDIQKQFDEDMKTYGGEKSDDKALFDPSTLYYSRLLVGMNSVIQARTDELIKSRALVADLQNQFKNREGMKDDAISIMKKGYDDLNAEVKKNNELFVSGQEATNAEAKRLTTAVGLVKDEAAKSKAAADAAEKEAQRQALEKQKELEMVLHERKREERKQMDVPSGEITWVSLPNKMVWINRGRADELQRQTKFTVYSGTSATGATAVAKGTVEVVKIEGDHMAQARILDDKLADPIMAGDKVFTPAWSPGQQNHFALTGIMNLDLDGRNQLSVVRGLIQQNGGVIDCELDEQGHKQGQVTANTRFIVVGDAPDKSTPEFQKNHGEILRDAERYKVQVLRLSDFKQQMNYQKTSSVEHFGARTTASDVSRAASAARARPAPKAAAPSEDADK